MLLSNVSWTDYNLKIKFRVAVTVLLISIWSTVHEIVSAVGLGHFEIS